MQAVFSFVRRPGYGLVIVLLAGLLVAGWANGGDRHPDVTAVEARVRAPGVYDFEVTVSSPYDTPLRYANAFRVTTKNGRVLGERILLHDHADEQPFTRGLYGVAIPEAVREVVVEARDRLYGYGGGRVELVLPVRGSSRVSGDAR